jgi:protoheme IX farnesyltransferase
MFKERFKAYYLLAKPGIIYGNALSAAAGFFLASKHHFSPGLFLAMLFGIAFVMASGCVFNNYIDRDIDALMNRTKGRALVKGGISHRNALIYATVLGIVGFWLLYAFTNPLTTVIGAIGLFTYVILYTYSKRLTVYGTLIGAVAGAVPPVVGYCAVTNHLDSAAWVLFFILVIWQMPHFYAIAIFRSEDYAAAKLPVLPVKSGIRTTKIHMLIYIIAFLIVSGLLTVLGYTGYIYLGVMVYLSLSWLRLAVQGFTTKNDVVWARSLFKYSLITLTTACVLLSISVFLP